MNTTTLERTGHRTAQVRARRPVAVQAAHRHADHGHRAGGAGGDAGRLAGPGPGAGAGAVGAGRIGSAGAFNQYVEHDSDRLMARTRRRAFVTGALPHHPAWLLLMGVLLAGAVAAAWFALNAAAAVYVFLGAFFYAVVYTVWLKRRSAWNIVVGGLAGSFAVLAGGGRRRSGARARCRCCWRWCCSCGRRRISGAWRSPTARTTRPPACRCCRWWWVRRARRASCFASTAALVAASLLPLAFGAGPIYARGRGGRRPALPAQVLAAGARPEPRDGDGFLLRVAGAAERVAGGRDDRWTDALKGRLSRRWTH